MNRLEEGVEWQGDTATVEVELSRPLIEWIALECEEDSVDTVEEWLVGRAKHDLKRRLLRMSQDTEVTVQIDRDVAMRACLWRDVGDVDTDDVLDDIMDVIPRYQSKEIDVDELL